MPSEASSDDRKVRLTVPATGYLWRELRELPKSHHADRINSLAEFAARMFQAPAFGANLSIVTSGGPGPEARPAPAPAPAAPEAAPAARPRINRSAAVPPPD